MAFIILTPNPFKPMDAKRVIHSGGISIWEWLKEQDPNFTEFPIKTICLVNGIPKMREDWKKKIGPNDIVNFITVPGEPITIALWIAVVVVIALSVAITLTMQQPVTPGQAPASDPVFSVKGQQNTIRLGEPIEVCYGRNRIYPSFAAQPYYQYVNNDQFQFSLFCLGQGQFEIHQVQISDTDIANYEEASYEVIPPGGAITLFPTNVVTSVEAGGQEIFGPNMADYPGPDGWVGPFVTNASNTEITKIELDIVMPKGLYFLGPDNLLDPADIVLQIQVRLVDDAGAPLGAFVNLPAPEPPPLAYPTSNYTLIAATTTPQRRTLTYTVAQGRYELRVRRQNPTDDGHKAGHSVVWEAMRGFVVAEDAHDYGDVTLLAVKIRATNNLNSQTAVKFNVVATRKLQTWNSGGFTDLIATRSIIWPFVDVFYRNYGGRIFDTAFFDWDTLVELDALYESRNEHFDWIFRDPITVWDAAKAIARAGRATPILVGSLISIKRDGPVEIPVTMFTQDNIVGGSFEWAVKLWDPDEFDSIRIEYTEPSTGYKQETVICTLPGGTTDNPQDIRLPGVQDRTHAYREGLFILASQRYLRENITIDTGLEGHIPSFGDLVAFSHDITRWGQAGFIVNAVRGVGNEYSLWLSEPLVWGEDTGSYQIQLRGKQGQIIGPLTAIRTTEPAQVSVEMPEDTAAFDFLLSGKTEPMFYQFGPVGSITKYGKVVKIEPQGNEIIRITAVNNDSRIHSFDELIPPALSSPAIPPTPPDLPTISRLYITQLDDTLKIIQVSWSAAFGALRYVVQTSEDGENWSERIETTQTSTQLQVRPGDLWVRVAAIGNAQGPWIQDIINIGFIAGLELYLGWDHLPEWGVRWAAVLGASGYEVKVYNAMATEPVLVRTDTLTASELSYVYDFTKATADGNFVREMIVSVNPILNDEPSSTPTTLDLSNSIPEAPESTDTPRHEFIDETSSGVLYRLLWDLPERADLFRVAVWLSDTTGFDPNIDTPVVDSYAVAPGFENCITETEVLVEFDTGGNHGPRYWRVACFDVWGNEISTNITDEQVIPAYL